ncbi:MAG: choice-of-anchor tandem repeat NxxGxxAF-containing protein [Planctomycetota bacterium]
MNYFDFGVPAINEAGQIAFRARLTGLGVDGTNHIGIWSEAAGVVGAPGLIARKGDPAPGTVPGVIYRDFGFPRLSASGQTAFFATLSGNGVSGFNNEGIWSEAAGDAGALGLIARAGDGAPDTAPGVYYDDFDNPLLNGAGQTAFFAKLFISPEVSRTNDGGIWSEAAGTVGAPSLIAREGDPAPGTAPGVIYGPLGTPAFNEAGQTAFHALLAGRNVGIGNGSIWSEVAGTVGAPGLVAHEGDAAPGTEPGVIYEFLSTTPVLNGAGQTAFGARIAGPGVDDTNNRGIWSEAAGAIGAPGLVVRSGEPAPGTSSDVKFSGFGGPMLNGTGQTAFIGFLTGPGVDTTNDHGIWSEAAGAIGAPGLVARKDDPALGTAPGVNYLGFFTDPVLNGAGQIAFRAFLTGPGVDDTNDFGLWAADPTSGGESLALIIREGDLFDVSDDPTNPDLRTVATFNVFTNTGNGDGRPSPLNDAGQIAFQASFTDGSRGVFVATIPDPASIALVGDYNGDGSVSQIDLDLVLLNWSNNIAPAGFVEANLPDGGPFDGLISQNELDGVLLNWGDGVPPFPGSVAVPEPGVGIWLAAGCLGMSRRRGSAR